MHIGQWFKQMAIDKNMSHQLIAIPNRYLISNNKHKCMETHINSSNHTLPLAYTVVCMDT